MKKLFLILILVKVYSVTFGQDVVKPKYNKYQFGFFLGTNYNNLLFEKSDWSKTNPNLYDVFRDVEKKNGLGLNIGTAIEYKLSPMMYFRMMPSLLIAESSLIYEKVSFAKRKVNLEFINAEMPFHYIIKSQDGNIQSYFFLGACVKYNLATNDIRPELVLNPVDFAIEIGLGIEKQYEFFRFAPEIKYSYGLMNLKMDQYNELSYALSEIYMHNISINFIFKS